MGLQTHDLAAVRSLVNEKTGFAGAKGGGVLVTTTDNKVTNGERENHMRQEEKA
jgi:hypothetical protein